MSSQTTRIVLAEATARLELHEQIEIEVADDATEEEIERLLREEAEDTFNREVVLSNGMDLDIEIDREEEGDDFLPLDGQSWKGAEL